MARINLRPWREEKRAKLQRDFAGYLIAAVLVAGVLVFGWQWHVNDMIDQQRARNSYLTNATKELDKKIKEIEDLKERREELLARMKVIQDLQGKRPVIVRVFDELVQTLPDGTYYTSVQKKGDRIVIVGRAESNNRISALMRNFERSEWFGEPNLVKVAKAPNMPGYNEFNLSVIQTAPEVEEGEKKK
ncbi:PilN domain-containing protein [Marinobacteraceae bacterium S3BR75-40.1]